MQSANGALRLVNAPATAAASHIEAPYDVHIRIPLTLGGVIDDTCNSAAIKQGAVSCNSQIRPEDSSQSDGRSAGLMEGRAGAVDGRPI